MSDSNQLQANLNPNQSYYENNNNAGVPSLLDGGGAPMMRQ